MRRDSTNSMTDGFDPFATKLIGDLATHLINEAKGVDRVGLQHDEQAVGNH